MAQNLALNATFTGTGNDGEGGNKVHDGNTGTAGYDIETAHAGGGWSITYNGLLEDFGVASISEAKMYFSCFGNGCYDAQRSYTYSVYYGSAWHQIYSGGGGAGGGWDSPLSWYTATGGPWHGVTAVKVYYHASGTGCPPYLNAYGKLSMREIQFWGTSSSGGTIFLGTNF